VSKRVERSERNGRSVSRRVECRGVDVWKDTKMCCRRIVNYGRAAEEKMERGDDGGGGVVGAMSRDGGWRRRGL
jgi:hypothetical protein